MVIGFAGHDELGAFDMKRAIFFFDVADDYFGINILG